MAIWKKNIGFKHTLFICKNFAFLNLFMDMDYRYNKKYGNNFVKINLELGGDLKTNYY